MHIGNGHASVCGLAHVVDGQQRYLYCSKGFHLHSGRPKRFGGGGALYGALGGAGCQLHGHARERQRMTQGNQVAGLLRCLDAGNARNAQHVAFFRGTGLDDRQRGRQHLDATGGNRDPVGGWLGADVHHVGLTFGVEVGERWWGRGAGAGHWEMVALKRGQAISW